ncbi:MAG: MarR family transcriptional regulator [Rhodospirillaceae bacterium]|nr:MarR family transcriptional regulator [Rhodospirillaceae bacterium]
MTDFDLTCYLPYLINRTGVRIASAFTDAIRTHGITVQMWRVLAALDHADGQRISDLAALTSIDVSTLSRLLDSMQNKALIERRRSSETDARVVTVHATDNGHAITGKLIPLARHYEAIALAGFTAAEAEALKAMLVRVYRNIEGIEDANEASTEAA